MYSAFELETTYPPTVCDAQVEGKGEGLLLCGIGISAVRHRGRQSGGFRLCWGCVVVVVVFSQPRGQPVSQERSERPAVELLLHFPSRF